MFLILKTLQYMWAALMTGKAKLKSLAATLNADLKKLHDDLSLDADFKRRKEKELRDATTTAMAGIVREIDSNVATMKTTKEFWLDKAFILSQSKFDVASAANDSIIRSARLNELTMMNSSTLQLVADAAKASKDFATLHLCLLAGQARMGQPGWKGIDLSDVVLPDREVALDILVASDGLAYEAHSIFAQAGGAVLWGESLLALAHAQQAQQPKQSIRRTTPDRPVLHS